MAAQCKHFSLLDDPNAGGGRGNMSRPAVETHSRRWQLYMLTYYLLLDPGATLIGGKVALPTSTVPPEDDDVIATYLQ